jgi:hypothetical protein
MTNNTKGNTARKTAAPAKSTQAAAPARSAPRARSAAKPVVVESAAAKPKHKLVRDSFTIPKSEYLVLEGLKLRAAQLTRPVKKSELLRAGISALHAMSDKAFLAALNSVPSLKTGRPKAVDATPVPAKRTKQA